jgi:hypothetical protein
MHYLQCCHRNCRKARSEADPDGIAQLNENTQQTVKQILVASSISEPTGASVSQTVSLAKQAQTWSQL